MAAALKTPLPTLDDVLREKHKRSFWAYVQDFWPIVEPAEQLQVTLLMVALASHGQRFIEALVADLRGEAWAKGYFQDLGIEVPPGSSKSMLFAVLLMTWAWGPYGCPWLRFMFSTYAKDLTLRDSRKRRDVIQSPLYQRLYGHLVSLKKDTNQAGLFENERRGWSFATSVDGQGTGHRPHVFIGDDLLNVKNANSEPEQVATEEHLSAMSSRGVRQPVYRRLIIGQRVCERDAGAWARKVGFEVLSLPTEFDPDTPAKTRIFKDWRTKRGELLNPLRFGPEQVVKARIEMGPYGYSAQHNQRAVPLDGGVIKPSWVVDRPALKRSAYGAALSSWDTAFTEKKENDQSAHVVLAVRPDGLGVDIIGAEGYHHEFPELQAEVLAQGAAWRPNIVLIEAKANGKSLIQQLQRSVEFPYHIEGVEPKLDKNGRAHAAAPFAARRLIGIDKSQPWAQVLMAQLESFPKGNKRDLADALVQALLYVDEHYVFNVSAREIMDVAVAQAKAIDHTPRQLPKLQAVAPEHHPEDYATEERATW